jgi:exopolysaccharide production protein ExoZ
MLAPNDEYIRTWFAARSELARRGLLPSRFADWLVPRRNHGARNCVAVGVVVAKQLRSIQLLRGVAACMIVILHAYTQTTEGRVTFVNHAGAGVDLFFVISGFIMAVVSQRRGPRAFLIERAWRIYPLWFIAVLPWLFTSTLTRGSAATSLTLWPIYFGQFHMPALEVGWTLCFEVVFYLAVAVAMLRGLRWPLAAFGLCFGLAYITGWPLFRFLGSPMNVEFLLGAALTRVKPRAALGPAAILLGVTAIALTPVGLAYTTMVLDPAAASFRLMFWGLPAALIVYGGLCLEQRLSSRTAGIGAFLGDASYSIYLFHPMVVYGLGLPWFTEAVLAVAAGCALHLAVERPIMRLRSLRVARASRLPAV